MLIVVSFWGQLAFGASYSIEVGPAPSLAVSPLVSLPDTGNSWLHYSQTPSTTTQINVRVDQMPDWLILKVDAPSCDNGNNQGPLTLTISPQLLITGISGATNIYWSAMLTYTAEIKDSHLWMAPAGIHEITVYYTLKGSG